MTPGRADTQPAVTSPPGRERGFGSPWLIAAAIAALAVLLYAPALSQGFAYDDVPLIQNDARVQAGLTHLGTILGTPYWGDGPLGLYRPLTTLSYAIDWWRSGGSPAAFHFTNVCLHALASALGFLLLARLFTAPAALIGALVFVAHPVHVEAVANVVGRAELIAAVLILAALLAWIAWSPGWRRTAAVGVCFALGLAAKESAVVLPALLLLLDAGVGRIRRGRFTRYIRENAQAIIALGAVFTIYAGVRLAVLGGLVPTQVDPVLEGLGATDRIWTAFQAWPQYARLLVFPVLLLADYGPGVMTPAQGVSGAAFAGLALFLCSLVGGGVALARGRRMLGLALLWFTAAILPVSNLLMPIGVLVAERTLYLPSLAIAMAAAGLAEWAFRRSLGRRFLVPATAALALLAGRSVLRIPDWRSTDSIMLAQLRDAPDSFRAHWHIARSSWTRGDTASALANYERAVTIWPNRRQLVIEAAAHYILAGRLAPAYELAGFAAGRWPDDLEAQRLLAGLALDLGDLDRARQAIGSGLAIAPDDDVLTRMRYALSSRADGEKGR